MHGSARVAGPLAPLAIVGGVGGLYVAQSVIGGITWSALPAVMRDQGLPLDRVGLISLIALPWALKFLWSPVVERYRLPPVGRNRSASIVLAGGLVSAAGLLIVGAIGPALLLPTLACLMAVAFAASTVDIACDGFAVETLAKEYHGWGNAAQVGGAYLGSAIGGGFFLVLVADYGWQAAAWSMAALLVLLGLPFLAIARSRSIADVRPHTPSVRSALARPEIRRGLIAAGIYIVAQKTGLAMLGPYLVDAGLSLSAVGLLNGIGSMCVGFAAALAGGVLVRRWGIRAVLITALLLQSGAYFFFATFDLYPGVSSSVLIGFAVASSSGVLAFGFVALYAQFMRWSNPLQAGIDFTLFQCMDALASMLGGLLAGYLAQHFGYGAFFAGSGIAALLAIPLIAKVSDGY